MILLTNSIFLALLFVLSVGPALANDSAYRSGYTDGFRAGYEAGSEGGGVQSVAWISMAPKADGNFNAPANVIWGGGVNTEVENWYSILSEIQTAPDYLAVDIGSHESPTLQSGAAVPIYGNISSQEDINWLKIESIGDMLNWPRDQDKRIVVLPISKNGNPGKLYIRDNNLDLEKSLDVIPSEIFFKLDSLQPGQSIEWISE